MAPLQHDHLSDKVSRYLGTIGLAASSGHLNPSPISINKLNARSVNLLPRSTTVYNPGSGTIEGTNIPNTFVFVLIGLILASFVITGVWFFFRARNGGFHWRKNDWDDYKSTVLRRKGPNGTTLSGATESTDLGGGSVYKDYDGHGQQSSLGSEMSYLKRKMKGKKREKFTGDKRSKSGKEKTSKLRGGDGNHNIDLEANTAYEPSYEPSNLGTVDDDMRAYRHEKPARVGGLNKAPDSSRWDGSTAPGTDDHSDLLSNQEPTPTKKEKKKEYTGGIRKVSNASTFWGTHKSKKKDRAKDDDDKFKSARRESKQSKNAAAIPEMSEASFPTSGNSLHIQEEARRLQELGRAAKNGRDRRDFSFQYGDDVTTQVSASEADTSVSAQARREARRRERREGTSKGSRSPEKRKSQSPSKRVAGGYDYGSVMSDEEHDGDLGTKSYHHPIPGLSDYLSASGNSGPSGSAQSSEVSGAGSDYAGEKRKRRAENRGGAGGGYRRG